MFSRELGDKDEEEGLKLGGKEESQVGIFPSLSLSYTTTGMLDVFDKFLFNQNWPNVEQKHASSTTNNF